MPRRLRVHLVDRGHHMAGAVGAKPYAMSDGWTEAGNHGRSGRGERTSLTARPRRRAATAASTVCICIAYFWPKPPPTNGDMTSTRSGVRPRAAAKPWRTRVCVLRALVHRELAVLPLCERGEQLDRVVVLGGTSEAGVDFYGGLFERVVGVAGDDLRNEC